MLRYDLMRLSLDAIRGGRLSLHPFRGGMMPRPIRGRLSLHPIHVLVSCGAKLPASRCWVCAKISSALFKRAG